jgi:chitodextrinase
MTGRRLLLSNYLVIASIIVCAQDRQIESTAAYDDFQIYFHQDLEKTPVGAYTQSQWIKDWNNPEGGVVCAYRTQIIDYNSGGRTSRGMKWNFPENSYSVDANYGYDWKTPIGETLEEVYLSFSIMFKPGFFVASCGKIPGVEGNPPNAMNKPEWDQGFGGSLLFKTGKSYPNNPPAPSFYAYHHDQAQLVGDSPRWNGYTFDVSTDIWYDVTYRIVMNTATATAIGGPDGLKDGIMEGFVNGKLWGQFSGLRLRNLASIGIDKARIQAFMGGGEESATIRDEWIMIDNVYIWNYSDEYLRDNPSVKRGRQANAIGIDIYTPFDFLFGEEQGSGTGPEDVDPPTVPTGLHAIDSTENSILLEWNSSTDNIGVTGYRIFVDGNKTGATGDTAYTIASLPEPGRSYAIAISAVDAEDNESPKSSAIHVFTRAKDTSPPTAPSNLRLDRKTSYSLEVSWNNALDNTGIDRYEVIVDGEPKYSTRETFIAISKLQPSTTYRISVRAYDISNNQGPLSGVLAIQTNSPDVMAPSAPGGLREVEVTEKTITLQWDPSTDNVGISKYRIYVNNIDWDFSTQTMRTIDRLQPGLEYEISVSAIDEAENESHRSGSIRVTTKNSDITTKPTLPSISIIQVQDNTIRPKSISEMSSLGYTELRSFGLEVTEFDNPASNAIILKGTGSTQVVNQNRIKTGLQALYNFSEGEGQTVKDLSGSEKPMDLTISREGLATEWLAGQGLRINEGTIISYEGDPERLVTALSQTNEVTLETWIKQEVLDQAGPARIVTLSADNSTRAVTLGHEGNKAYYNYISRLTTDNTDINGNPQLGTSQDFISSSLHHVVYTRNVTGLEKIYVNGMVLASGNREGDFTSWGDDLKFALGNEISGERPWKGTYYLVAVYNRALMGEEVNQNYNAGFGQIRFVSELDTLESNVGYTLKPFINTDQGLVYGNSKDFIYQNVAKFDSLFTFYPNPNKGQISVTIKNKEEGVKKAYLKLADFSGRIHFSQEIDLSEGLLEKSLEIQLPGSIENGFYTLILTTGNKSAAEKFILVK